MGQDKAIKKVLYKDEIKGLPYGFDQKVMKAIFIENEAKKKRTIMFNLSLVSIVSLIIISSAVYILHSYTSFSITIPKMSFSNETINIILFSFYIGALVLILLILDTFLRRLKQNQHK